MLAHPRPVLASRSALGSAAVHTHAEGRAVGTVLRDEYDLRKSAVAGGNFGYCELATPYLPACEHDRAIAADPLF